MSIIKKKVTYTSGYPECSFQGVVLDKYEKVVSWSTGIGHAQGTNTYYIIELNNKEIVHIDPSMITKVSDYT